MRTARAVVAVPALLLCVLLAAAPSAPGSIAGVVKDADGQPVRGARVVVASYLSGRAPFMAVTGDDGSFRVADVPPDTYSLSATAPGHTAALKDGVRLASGQTIHGVALALTSGGHALAGQLRGVGHVRSTPRLSVLRIPGFAAVLPEVGPAGLFQVTLPAGRYLVEARGTDLEPAFDYVTLPGTAAVTLSLHPKQRPPSKVIERLRRSAAPLKTCLAGHGFTDLQQLKSLIGNARIVAFGEATHGTSEFYRCRHRLLEYLASEMGFTALALESPWPESLAFNDYVLGGKGTANEAVSSLGMWIWQNVEMTELADWARGWNQRRPPKRKLHVVGFDLQRGDRAAARVIEYLAKVDSIALAEWRSVLEPIAGGRDINPGGEVGKMAALLARFDERRGAYIAASTEQEWGLVRQHARILAQRAELFAHRGHPSEVRDRFMAENIAWLLQEGGPHTKLVVWGHNGHLGMSKTGGADSLGHHLRQQFGQQVLVVAAAFGDGEFRAIDLETGANRTFRLGPSKGSLDDALARTGHSLLLLDVRKAAKQRDPLGSWWQFPHSTRWFGAAYREGAEEIYEAPIRSDDFDALLFVRHTTPSRLVIRLDPIEAGSAPRNLGFEEGTAGQWPPGWMQPPYSADSGYRATLTDSNVHEGKLSLLFERSSGPQQQSGMVRQRFDAVPYRGKRIRLRAAVRVEGNGAGHLWLRVERQTGEVALLEQMQEQPILVGEWAEYEVSGTVAADAVAIGVGAGLRGNGRVWVDSMRIEAIQQ